MADESQYRLRIPADLKAKLEAAAKASGRSMNAQVIHTLQLALDQADEMEEMREFMSEMEKRIDKLEVRVADHMHSTGFRDY